jgi:hypothetical protein
MPWAVISKYPSFRIFLPEVPNSLIVSVLKSFAHFRGSGQSRCIVILRMDLDQRDIAIEEFNGTEEIDFIVNANDHHISYSNATDADEEAAAAEQ